MSPNFSPGARLGRYEIKNQLGAGEVGEVYLAEAIAEYRKALALNDDPYAKAFLVRSLAKSGRRADALELVEELKSESATRYVPNYCLAMAYTALGEKEEAFALLKKILPNIHHLSVCLRLNRRLTICVTTRDSKRC